MTLVSCGILLRNCIWHYVCEMQSSAQEAIDEFALDQVIKDAPSEPIGLHVAFVTNRIVRVIGIISKQKGRGECILYEATMLLLKFRCGSGSGRFFWSHLFSECRKYWLCLKTDRLKSQTHSTDAF